MKHTYHLLLIFIVQVVPLFVYSQSNFQVVLDSQGYYLNDVVANESDEILAFITDNRPEISNYYYLLPMDGQTAEVHGWKIEYVPSFKLYYVKKAAYFGNTVCFSHSGGANHHSAISCFNIATGSSWSKKLNFHPFWSATFDMAQDKSVIATNGFDFNTSTSDNRWAELRKFDEFGNALWQKGIKYSDNSTSNDYIIPYEVKFGQDSHIFLAGFYPKDVVENINESFIVKLDSSGNPMISKSIKKWATSKMEVGSDGVYLLDCGFPEHNLAVAWRTSEQAVLIKLDFDLNFVWAKKYSAEKFPYLEADIIESSNADLIFSHTTFGAFPAILSQVNKDGEIISQKGYPNYSPKVRALNNGGLLLGSRYTFDATGGTFVQPVVAKTDSAGNIDNCTEYPTCLEVSDIPIEMDTLVLEFFPISPAEPNILTSEPAVLPFSNYCNFPPAPVPTFTFPDTLCLGDTATSVSEGNRLAQAREWRLTGPGMDSVLTDSFEFSFHFTETGDYVLSQAVWVLGCRSEYEHKITVLPPLALNVQADSLLCPGNLQEIRAEASPRPAIYTWSNGHVGPVNPISTSGTYSVTATDGYCEATGNAKVTVAEDFLNGAPPFTLPLDTTTCQPHDLVPQSMFSELFFTDTDPTPRPSIRLEAAGSYRIGMMAFGCEFWEDYHYGVDCHIDVYLPTSFSPNGDGINDVFMPFGSLFEVLELRVYDRWGGLLHQGREWDGGRAGQGVYLFELTYLNLRSGLEEEVNGQVLLVK